MSTTAQSDKGLAIFSLTALAITLMAALIATLAPIACSIAIVFLFAGPHNWLELRYFLSRLPARFARSRTFFIVSFAGLTTLFSLYLGLIAGIQFNILSDFLTSYWMIGWNCLFVCWIWSLKTLSVRQGTGITRKSGNQNVSFFPAALAALLFGAIFAPEFFSLSLVYAHPFIGMCILDRELSRSKPAWRRAYHLCLGTVPVMLAILWMQTHNAPQLPDKNLLDWQIIQHAGAGLMSGMSSHFLVASHTFLEMLHYAVWLVAIPLVSAGWQSYTPRSMPMACRSSTAKKGIGMLLALSTAAVVALWMAFGINFTWTREIYFTLALAHVLAEVPFLLRSIN